MLSSPVMSRYIVKVFKHTFLEEGRPTVSYEVSFGEEIETFINDKLEELEKLPQTCNWMFTQIYGNSVYFQGTRLGSSGPIDLTI